MFTRKKEEAEVEEKGGLFMGIQQRKEGVINHLVLARMGGEIQKKKVRE